MAAFRQGGFQAPQPPAASDPRVQAFTKPSDQGAQTIVTGMEEAHANMVNWTINMAKQLGMAIGERPFGTEKLPERTQAAHGGLLYNDPEAWDKLLKEHGWQGPGQPVPKSVVKYAQNLETLRQKFPEDFNSGVRAYQSRQVDNISQVNEGTNVV